MSLLFKLPRLVAALSFLPAIMSLSVQAQIVINEIHYDPDVKTELVEFVELFNAGQSAVNLAGWKLEGGIDFTFPNGVSIPAGGYLVVGQNPTMIQSKFAVTALGPWTGRLSSSETITLVNASESKEDEVSYQLGFPWPTVGDSPGYSIELANPQFDNDIGGNWRGAPASTATPQSFELINADSTWRYFKGPDEASDPTTSWRTLNFNDSGWLTGATPIGYGEAGMATQLNDMQGNYVTVFLRQKFVVTNLAEVRALVLEAMYDDGFKVWINGNHVLDANMPSGEVAATTSASSVSRESLDFATFNLTSAHTYLTTGTNIIAIQAANGSLGNSSDFFINVRLKASAGSSGGPTPGRVNFAFTTNVPPQLRQVKHLPEQPTSGTPVVISAKATDPEGVSSVSLQYQLVDPGSYIELTDTAYTNTWTTLAMNDAGTGGDAVAGDSVYSVTIPGNLQQHRRLVRYRITATDSTGRSIRAPYVDHPQPNFAYFCYDGVPAWQSALQPGVTPVQNFSTNVMRRLPVVHLLAQNSAVHDATWGSRYGGDVYLWQGTLVYDGKVYDHIRYRARGGVWRYAMAKNMWKFDFNRGHDFEMRDDYGRKFGTTWKKLNLGACIQQGDFGHRGEQGMFESVGFRLFNLAGVESPYTAFLQFRVIDDAAETTGSQYEGDFWGLYLAIEQEDGQFLDEHGLPDGNLYKMEAGTGELNNLGLLGPSDKSDLNAFLGTYNNTTPTDDWWRTNLDLQRYYSYRTIVEGIHHYDIGDGKNYFFFRNPESGLWATHTWDLDLTWANNMYGSGAEPFRDRVLPRTAFNIEYDNRIREIRDLLFNTNQAWQVIDECAWIVRGPTNVPTFLDADRNMWDFNPKMSDTDYTPYPQKAGQGRYYQWPNEPSVSKDFNGAIQLMKNYVSSRGLTLDNLANDAAIPAQPVITYIGVSNFPLNRLSFRSSAYSGSSAFAAMKWRVGEVRDTNAPAYDPTEPWPYEINAKWESGDITTFNQDVTLPADALKPGHAYRVRVRMKDVSGRWSHWSAPIQFICGTPENAAVLASNLRISELMFDPTDGSEYEFVELHNTSTNQTLELDGAAFTSGISYTFPNGSELAPGGYLLVIQHADAAAFRSNYGLGVQVPIFGPFSGSLANAGEKVTLKTSASGIEISDFEYTASGLWPLAAAGAGHSMVPLNPAASGQASGALDYPGNWRASTYRKGSPGAADPQLPAPTVLLNEIVAHTDYEDPLRPEYDSDDWIEVFNSTATNINLSGWYLSDDPAEPAKWAIPSVNVPARGWLTFSEVTNFHNPITTGFGLNKAGEQVLLSYLPGTSQDRVVDAVRFKGQDNEASLARYVDGSGFWFGSPRTRTAANTTPFQGIRISEIMYRPPDLGTNDNARDEFIEMFNPTASAISLQDSNGVWRLGGGVSFTFPTNTTIPAGGVLLAVSFAPTNAAASNLFRSVYGITGSSLRLVGPYSGKLGNRSDRVALERPQLPDVVGDTYSWIVLDEVTYGNQSPWPDSANGLGESLQRRSVTWHGNDPVNWYAAIATPSDAQSDRDGDGLPNDWELDHSLNPDNSADATVDSDLDGLTNLQEFLCGTDPWNAASTFRFDSVSAMSGGAELRFTAAANRSYTIQSRTALGSENWQTWTNISAAPTLRVMSIPVSSAGTNARFFRLVTPGF